MTLYLDSSTERPLDEELPSCGGCLLTILSRLEIIGLIGSIADLFWLKANRGYEVISQVDMTRRREKMDVTEYSVIDAHVMILRRKAIWDVKTSLCRTYH